MTDSAVDGKGRDRTLLAEYSHIPSINPQVRRAIGLSVGLLLLTATVLAPFGTLAWTYEYDVARVAPDDPQLASLLAWPDKTATCYPDTDGCELAYTVRDEGPHVVSDTKYRAATGFSADTRLIIFPKAHHVFYKPTSTRHENDSTHVALELVSNATALNLASTPVNRFPGGVQRLIAEEHVRTNHPLTGMSLWEQTHAIVAHDGMYYRRGSFTYRGTMRGVADLLRLAVLVIGAALCYHAGRIG